MENILNYYYNLIIKKMDEVDDSYYIYTDDGLYILNKLIIEVSELERIINYLNNTKEPYHLLVLNKDKELFTLIEEEKYVLFKVRCDLNKEINPLLFSSYILNGDYNWSDVWSKRIDYYETQLNEVVNDVNVFYAMNYYIGLTENAISYYINLIDMYGSSELIYAISHRRITSPIKAISYYNPANMIIDLNVRDIAEYIKMSFFEDILTDSEILTIVNNLNFNNIMANMFLVRLIYPSYFFNLYDQYIESREVNKKMFLYMKKSHEYESLITKIYSRLSIKNNIKAYMWIFKVQR